MIQDVTRDLELVAKAVVGLESAHELELEVKVKVKIGDSKSILLVLGGVEVVVVVEGLLTIDVTQAAMSLEIQKVVVVVARWHIVTTKDEGYVSVVDLGIKVYVGLAYVIWSS